MKQLEFERHNQAVWSAFETALDQLDAVKPAVKGESCNDFVANYRRVCQHLAVAKSRRYSAGLLDRLNDLSVRGYLRLYAGQRRRSVGIMEFLVHTFPVTLRANAVYVWIALLAFYLPLLLMVLACLVNADLIFSVIDPAAVRGMEAMYDPTLDKLGRERQSDSDLMMFGYYIFNNISISFQSFALGITFGIGTFFVLIYNGLVIGGVAGYLSAIGYTETFFPFVIGHGSFELTAIAFSGAAGLKLGYAILNPGELTRLAALQYAAGDAIKIVYGSTIMLLIAAFIEAFWSSSQSLPVSVKYTVGAALWLLVITYCVFTGRSQRESNAA